MSPPYFLLNSTQQCSTIRLSKSSPPKCVSPAVALTSNIPCSWDIILYGGGPGLYSGKSANSNSGGCVCTPIRPMQVPAGRGEPEDDEAMFGDPDLDGELDGDEEGAEVEE